MGGGKEGGKLMSGQENDKDSAVNVLAGDELRSRQQWCGRGRHERELQRRKTGDQFGKRGQGRSASSLGDCVD